MPSTLATDVVSAAKQAGFEGIDTRPDPIRDYLAGDVAANLIGFMGTDEPLGGLERTFDTQLSGTDGSACYEIGGGNRLPLGESTITRPVDGKDLRTTIDQDRSGSPSGSSARRSRTPRRLRLRGRHGQPDRGDPRAGRPPDVRREPPAGLVGGGPGRAR